MRNHGSWVVLSAVMWIGGAVDVWGVNPTGYGQAGGEYDITIPRVPSGALAQARQVRPPFEPTPEILAEGKAIFLGMGGCVSCHGPEGRGDGAAAKNLPIQPRNFTNPNFHTLRTPGELMWVLKNGSMGQSGRVPGTGMLPGGPAQGVHYGRTGVEGPALRIEPRAAALSGRQSRTSCRKPEETGQDAPRPRVVLSLGHCAHEPGCGSGMKISGQARHDDWRDQHPTPSLPRTQESRVSAFLFWMPGQARQDGQSLDVETASSQRLQDAASPHAVSEFVNGPGGDRR